MDTSLRGLAFLLLATLASCAAAPTLPTGSDARVDVDSYTLLGDVALQREQPSAAAEYYLKAALISSDPALAERTTTLAYRIERTDIGLAAAKRWLALAPDSAQAIRFLALLALRAGHVDEALAQLRILIERAPDPGAGLGATMELLASEAEPEQAVQVMQALVEEYPGTPQGHYGLARLALTAGNFELALDNAQRAAEIDPQWIDAQLLYARTLLLGGRSEEALALAARLAAENSDVEVSLQYAELLLSAGHADEAEARLNDILAQHSGLPQAVRALAFLAMTRNDLDAAEERFNELRGDSNYRDEAFYYLGRIAETRGEYLQATRSYSRVTEGSHAVESQIRTARILFSNMDDQEGALRHLREFGAANPDYESQMLLAQGQILLELHRPTEAMQLLADALAEHPDDEALRAADVQLHVIIAQDATNSGDLARAEHLLDQALTRYPGDTTIRYAQALLYQQQGRLRRAVTVLEGLVKARPEDASLLNALGYLLTDQFRRHDEARGYIQKALTLEPDNPAIIDSMGWVLYKLGQYGNALDYLERAFRLDDDPEIAAHLIDTHLALGQPQEAAELLEASLAKHPDNPLLLALGRRLAQ